MILNKSIGAFAAILLASALLMPSSQALTITDGPAPVLYVGHFFALTPAVNDAPGAKISFRLYGTRPAWLNFSAATGTISGTPTQPGVWSHMWLGAWDGQHFAWAPLLLTVKAATAATLKISGVPPATVVAGQPYSFTPTAAGGSAKLAFGIANKPKWAQFSALNGALTGTPGTADVGTTSNIVISVSDGKLSATLPAFSIAVTNPVSVTPPGGTPPGGNPIPTGSPCSAAMTGSHATYEVGPGKTYTELTDVPWLSLQAGDVVNIYYRATPYLTKFALKAQGTAAAPVVINGVTDSNCNQPVVSGTNAVYAADRAATGYDNQYSLGDNIIYIWWGNGGWAKKPKFITIQNLKLTGGVTGIYAVTVEDLLVQNCEITDVNGWGVFVNTKNDDPAGEETSYRVTIRNNRIYGNGVSGSYLYHNLYVQSDGATYEGNYIGQLRPGAQGSSLKDRSAGTIIRYNTIVAAARAIDLVETEGGHGTVDADPLYPDAWVYGNVIINDDSLPGVSSGALIHWGYDNNPAEARTGTLHFFDNTVVSSIHGSWSGAWIALFDQQSNNSSVDPHNTVEVQNSILWETGAALEMGKTIGSVNFVGRNWISTGWGAGDPNNANTVKVTGQATLIQGTNPGLDANDAPLAGSPVIGQAAGTTPLPVVYEFKSPDGVAPRATAKDLGAFEHQ